MSIACKLFPAKLDFPNAVKDLSSLSGEETTVRLTADAVGFHEIAGHPGVRTLWCCGIDESRLATIVQCERLEALYLEDVRATDLVDLAAVRRLSVLSVDGATKVNALEWLARLAPLSQLRLQHFPQVRTLEPLAAQGQLEALDVSGSMWTRMKVGSFAPLGDLSNLRLLYLTNIAAHDGSLRPLARLKQLQELHVARFYSWQEFAALAGSLPGVNCSWFAPFVTFESQSCDACNGSLVMLTGKRQPTICPRCSADRVRRHVDRFTRGVQQAAQQANATDAASLS